MGHRPIVVSKPLDELAEDRGDRRIACLDCGPRTREIPLACRNEIAVEICHVADPCEICASSIEWRRRRRDESKRGAKPPARAKIFGNRLALGEFG